MFCIIAYIGKKSLECDAAQHRYLNCHYTGSYYSMRMEQNIGWLAVRLRDKKIKKYLYFLLIL